MRFLLLIAALPVALSAQTFPSLDKTIEVAKTNALRSSNVDWPAVDSKAHKIASSQGEDAAIRYVISALGDHHTFYNHSVPIAETRAQSSGIPILAINSWSGSFNAVKAATQDVLKALLSSTSNTECGIILDFSQNSGGNMWPMLNGLSPLLADGLLGNFRDSKGSMSPIEKKEGVIYQGGKPSFASIGSNPRIPLKAIAIVVGPRTSSSGEITAIMFKGQSNVRFFGQPTSGYTTSNSTVTLPNDGKLILTTAETMDRNGVVHEKITPDQITDTPITDGAVWVNSQCRSKPN